MPPSPYPQMPWLPMPTSRSDTQPCRLGTRTVSFSFKKNNKCRRGAGQGRDRVFDTSCAARCREASRGLASCPDAARTAFCAAVPETSCRPTFARRFATSTGRVTGALRTGFGSRRLSTLGSSTPCLGGTGGSAPETAWSGFMKHRKKAAHQGSLEKPASCDFVEGFSAPGGTASSGAPEPTLGPGGFCRKHSREYFSPNRRPPRPWRHMASRRLSVIQQPHLRLNPTPPALSGRLAKRYRSRRVPQRFPRDAADGP